MNEKQQQPQIDVLRDYLGNEAIGKIQLLSVVKAQLSEIEALKKNDKAPQPDKEA